MPSECRINRTVDLPSPVQRISVVVPFFNEAENIAPFGIGLRTAIERCEFQVQEVLAVNDGSDDQTGEELEKLASTWPLLRVLHHDENRGQAAALLTGFSASVGEIIVTMDGDGQNDPNDISLLIRHLENGVDMVAGKRALRRDSTVRRSMSRLANAVRHQILHDGVTDSGCALKAFRRKVCESFIPIRTLYSFMPALAVAAGYRVKEVPVSHHPRTRGESKYGLRTMAWKPTVDMLGVWWFAHRNVRKVASQLAIADAPSPSHSLPKD